MALYQYATSSKTLPQTGKTEFDILKTSHRFLRDEDAKDLSWDEQLASKYYASLYREFAVCDLKHYKSGNFALRWRTESEVLSGAGETTCGNTRCEHHNVPENMSPSLTTLELPFAYVEHGENKSALVKVVLCSRCLNKLMWKRRKDKERALELAEESSNKTLASSNDKNTALPADPNNVKIEEVDVEISDRGRYERRSKHHSSEGKERRHRKHSSRSHSPRQNYEPTKAPRRHHSRQRLHEATRQRT